jgi:uncharacterized protein (TIGR00369 family)
VDNVALPRLTAEEIQDFLKNSFSQTSAIVDAIGNRTATVRLKIDEQHLRPGGTVSGPTLMALADTATYVVILAEIGIVPLAVTTNLNISFMRKPAADRDLIATAMLLKLGQRLAVAEVKLYSEGSEDVLAHATLTYSIPPRGGD